MSGGGWIIPVNITNRKATAIEVAFISLYQQLRKTIHTLEQTCSSAEQHKQITEDECKSFDKSIVLLKVGAKLIKKILKARGFRELKPDELKEVA